MTKKWVDVQDKIERLYLIQRIPLEKVRQQMLQEHGFAASNRAYKAKFKEWKWKTYRKGLHQDSGCANGPQYRIRPCRKALLSICTQLRLKTLKNNLEIQTRLIGRGKDHLNGLQHAIYSQNLEGATSERLSQSIVRITEIEWKIIELKKCIEELQGIEMQKSVSTGFAATWKKEPMTLEDALGRLIPVPLDIVVSWKAFEELLAGFFRVCPGTKKVQRGEYEIADGVTRVPFSKSQPWPSFSTPGRKLEMSMRFKDRSKSSVVCPKCETISNEEKGKMIECKNDARGMLFRTEEEEDQLVHEARPRSPHSSSQIEILYPLMMAGRPEEEKDDEDTPGMFKRVVIQIAKLSYMQTSTTTILDATYNTDFLGETFSPYPSTSLQISAGFYPLQQSSFENDQSSVDWAKFIAWDPPTFEDSSVARDKSRPSPPNALDWEAWDRYVSNDEQSASFLVTQLPVGEGDGVALSTIKDMPNLDHPSDINSIRNGSVTEAAPYDSNTFLTCNAIWDRLQAVPEVIEGTFDLDLLCKDLQSIATCSDNGAMVRESDFSMIMKRFANGPPGKDT